MNLLYFGVNQLRIKFIHFHEIIPLNIINRHKNKVQCFAGVTFASALSENYGIFLGGSVLISLQIILSPVWIPRERGSDSHQEL